MTYAVCTQHWKTMYIFLVYLTKEFKILHIATVNKTKHNCIKYPCKYIQCVSFHAGNKKLQLPSAYSIGHSLHTNWD